MDCKIINKLFSLLIIFTTTQLNAIEFKGKFIQGHFILGQTEPGAKILIDKKEIKVSIKEKYGFKNLNMSPEIEKIVINMGLGIDGNDNKITKACEEDLSKITGQKPVTTKFKKSVANFKTRKGSNAGLKVTLRKNKMYEFLDRLVNIALPRIKDFRGLSPKGFDKFGNYTFGIKEQIIFPEVSFERADKVRGIDIIVVITSKSKEHSFALLEKLNFPFIKKGEN